MDLRLAGRVALATGASSGPGRAIAREPAAEGAPVAMVARYSVERRRGAEIAGAGGPALAVPGGGQVQCLV